MTAVDMEVTRSAVLDEAHVGDIRGALGTIRLDDTAARTTLSAKLKTLLAIVGPGLIVMIGDNDAGAFSTYGQAGQDYGTRLLWTLLLLIPVLYVNQEMVLRLGAVTGVGHARLILARFGKFWGAFSVIDLFVLNALTIMTEFIGITLAAGYLGVPKVVAVAGAALIIVASAFTGSFRRFERIAMTFCVGSLLLIPLYFMSHPTLASMGRGFAIPELPGGGGQMATVMLLVIGIVGTTVAPWQLFFQQSYVIDKRITPRFMKYEKADLWIGIGDRRGRRGGADGRHRRRVRRAPAGRATSPTRPGSRTASPPTPGTSPGWCSRSRCSTRPSSARSRSRSPAPTRSATCSG